MQKENSVIKNYILSSEKFILSEKNIRNDTYRDYLIQKHHHKIVHSDKNVIIIL